MRVTSAGGVCVSGSGAGGGCGSGTLCSEPCCVLFAALCGVPLDALCDARRGNNTRGGDRAASSPDVTMSLSAESRRRRLDCDVVRARPLRLIQAINVIYPQIILWNVDHQFNTACLSRLLLPFFGGAVIVVVVLVQRVGMRIGLATLLSLFHLLFPLFSFFHAFKRLHYCLHFTLFASLKYFKY